MRWSARQRSMLDAMGIRLWDGASADAADASVVSASELEASPAVAAQVGAATVPPHHRVERVPGRAPTPASAPDTPQTRRPAADTRAATEDRTGPAPDRRPAPAPAALPRTVPDDARSRAIAAMDWTALKGAVAGCTACSLCESRRHTVFGVGHEQADWMLVGEAPGEQEDLQGEPFVGAAGQLLDGMLAAVGLTRQPAEPARQVYIANTLKCRPPRNRNPSDEELAACAPHLHRQIELVQPRLLLATGRYAVRQLLGSEEAIGRLRGRLHDYRGIPVVVTYHPSYLLRQPTEKGKAWRDLLLAASVLGA